MIQVKTLQIRENRKNIVFTFTLKLPIMLAKLNLFLPLVGYGVLQPRIMSF